MKELFIFLLCVFTFSCQLVYNTECDIENDVPSKIKKIDAEDQFYMAKWILYKVNISLGSGVQAGMPGSELFVKKVKSLTELDLIFTSHSILGDTTVFTFEFEGGVYPSDHPYYNTIEFYSENENVDVSESDRFRMSIRKDDYEDAFNFYLDTIGQDIAPFLKCYSPN